MFMERREFEARHNCDLVEKKSFSYLLHLPKQGKSVCSHFVGIRALFNCKAIYLYEVFVMENDLVSKPVFLNLCDASDFQVCRETFQKTLVHCSATFF